ncbi:MAG: penicillin-binding transpeptidase domain-containing protein, partial [Chloroflexota bacterium]
LSAGHGRLNLVSGLTQSCNSVFYELGKRLDESDPAALPSFAAQCGFGASTGALPGQEPEGIVPGPAWKRQALQQPWVRGDAVNMAIGQGQLLVTPLQVASLYAAIAAGGQRPGSRLLDRALLPGGNVERLLAPPGAAPAAPLPWSAATLDAVRAGLRDVVGGPNGTAAFVFQGSPLVPITAGKTGTAEAGPGRAPHAWFACFAPIDAPRVVVLAMVEHGGEGSQVAAPVARRVLEAALR